jgi:hypothetical protein
MTRPALRSDPCPGPMPSKPLRALPYEQLFLSITRVAVHADIDADAVQPARRGLPGKARRLPLMRATYAPAELLR